MYKRANISTSTKSGENSSEVRYRNELISFRVTAEEKKKLERRMELSGLTKADFFIQSLMNQKVVCLGNVKSFDEMRVQLNRIEEHLRSVEMAEELDAELITSLRMILELFCGLNKVEN